MKRRHFVSLSAAAAVFPAACTSQKSSTQKTLHVFTWSDYLDPELKQEFEQAYDCEVVLDFFDSNEAMYAKLKTGATGYDLLVPTSYMVKTLVKEGMLRALEPDRLPSLGHIDPEHLKSALDPGMVHSVPYMMAPTGIGYLASKVTDLEPTWKMLARPDLKGRVTMLNDMRETLGAALKTLGHDLNSTVEAELQAAAQLIREWKPNLAKFENEQYKTGLASGEFHLVHGYAGDIVQVQEENSDIQFFVPQEGSPLSCDDLVIPTTAKNPELAHALIEFLNEPTRAARNMEFIGYLSPNQDAWKLVSQKTRENPAIFLAPEVRSKCQPFDALGENLAVWSRAWDIVKAG